MTSKAIYTILLLLCSNTFMTFAWYGHLKMAQMPRFANIGLMAFILISWAIAFVEYCLQVPANRIGFDGNGGPFNLMQLKVIQEVITLTVFTIFSILVFGNMHLQWNHFVAFILLIGAVFFVFYK